jgi:hypothetical protein
MKHLSMLSCLSISLIVVLLMVGVDAQAQCAMCSLTAENATQNGNVQGKGLNNGILFLLAMPYLAAIGIGFLWYTRFRKKKQRKFQSARLTS